LIVVTYLYIYSYGDIINFCISADILEMSIPDSRGRHLFPKKCFSKF